LIIAVASAGSTFGRTPPLIMVGARVVPSSARAVGIARHALAQQRAEQPLVRHRHAVGQRKLRRKRAHHFQSRAAFEALFDRHAM
jgi:hypothetical protein